MEKKLVAECEAYAKEYMDYLSVAKTERRAYAQAVKLLEKAGFKEISSVKTLKPGDKVYRGYHGKTVMAAVIGRKPVADGIRVVGGHTDAPRLDLKPKPLYEKEGVVYFDTHIYGGIKKYQWLVLPLAIYGTIVKKDGKKVEVALGDKPGDPVFMISDLLPHLAHDLEKKTIKEFYPAEDLDVIASVGKKEELLKLIKKQFGVEEADFLSAELEVVPAGMPREVGLDRSLIAAYGHDDRVCAYAGLSALLKLKGVPDVTASIVMCDKEEIGSMGATGMQSSSFENTVAEMLVRQGAKADIDRCSPPTSRRRRTRTSRMSIPPAMRRSSRVARPSPSTRAARRRAVRPTRARSSWPWCASSSMTTRSRGRWPSWARWRRAAAARSRSTWRGSAWT